MSIWLVGAGPMAEFHAAVLADIGADVTIVATSATRALPLAEKHGMAHYTQGLMRALDALPRPDAAIVALPVDRLAGVALALAQAGVPRILLEKPGALRPDDLDPVCAAARDTGSQVFVAYNRRFFAAVAEARRRIAASDAVLSFSFEFCENADQIAGLPTSDDIKQHWVIANSSHVIDLAFHLCGLPQDWQHKVAGSLPWHTSGSDFRGMGQTETGAAFSYFADWRGPGRWGLEIVLPQERLFLRPMESLSVMRRGTFQAVQVAVDNALDLAFKPGLHTQMTGFLALDPAPELVRLDDQITMMREIYDPMAGYVGSAVQ